MSTHTSETVHTVDETTPLPTTPQVEEEVQVRKRLITSNFLSTFVMELVYLVALAVLFFSVGVVTDQNGYLSVTLNQIGTTIAFLFGGGLPTLLVILVIAVIVAGFWGAHRLLQRENTFAALILIFVLALITFTVVQWANNSDLNFTGGIIPLLGLLIVAGLKTLWTARRVSVKTTRLRKGVTNH